jgi:hypothetical protein
MILIQRDAARDLPQAGVDLSQRRVAGHKGFLSPLVQRRVDRVEMAVQIFGSPVSGKQPRLFDDEPGDLCVR